MNQYNSGDNMQPINGRLIRILYFSDVLCIWAYIAQIRLDELQTAFQDKILIQHHFVPVFGNAREKLEKGWRDRGGLPAYSQHVQDVTKKFSHVTLHPDIWTKVVPASSTACHLFLHAIQLLERKGILQPSEDCLKRLYGPFEKHFLSG